MKNISFRNDVMPLKDKLFRLALRITLDRPEAEDVVQEALVKVWNRRERWQELESIEAFCLKVTRNVALDHIKKKGHDNESLGNVGKDRPDTSSDPHERMIQKDRLAHVKKIIDGLPEKQRSCIQLRDIEGKPYKEIAEILDITEEQVKVSIFRARQTIKTKYLELDKYGL